MLVERSTSGGKASFERNRSLGSPRHRVINRDKPPFDNPELRRAMCLTLDRKAFIDIITDGQALSRRLVMTPHVHTAFPLLDLPRDTY
jgi:ABC-type transport system substrate-binding protein